MNSVLSSPNPRGPVVLCIHEMSYAFPFGIGYVAGYLKARGREVKILFWPSNPKDYPRFARQVLAERPLFVGFGSLFPNLYPIKGLVDALDEAGRDVPVALGGQMVTPTPEMSLRVTGADIGVVGEGEIVAFELAAALAEGRSPAEVAGLVVRSGEDVALTGPGAYIQDLSELPAIPYELFPLESWHRIGKYYTRQYQQPHWRYRDRVVSIHGGRGCPYNCNFCYHHGKTRYRKLEEMIEETDRMTRAYSANMVYFGDDLVLATPRRAQRLVELLDGLGRPLEYSVSCRFDILDRMDDGLLEEMKRTGCRIMGLGIESAVQRILDVMNKKITVDQIHRGLDRLKRVGILPTVSIMVGQETETEAEVEESIRFMRQSVAENKNIQYAFTIATPFPGSDMFRRCVEKGLLKDEYDFHRRFNPDWTFSALSVNASAMDDATVIRLYHRIRREYDLAKRRAVGPVVPLVEGLRGRLAAWDERLRAARTPPRVYQGVYDAVQVALDNTRLALLGVA